MLLVQQQFLVIFLLAAFEPGGKSLIERTPTVVCVFWRFPTCLPGLLTKQTASGAELPLQPPMQPWRSVVYCTVVRDRPNHQNVTGASGSWAAHYVLASSIFIRTVFRHRCIDMLCAEDSMLSKKLRRRSKSFFEKYTKCASEFLYSTIIFF